MKNTKKIIGITFLSLFLTGLLFGSFAVNAQLVGKWYFAGKAMSNASSVVTFGPYASEAECYDHYIHTTTYMYLTGCKNLAGDSDVNEADFPDDSFQNPALGSSYVYVAPSAPPEEATEAEKADTVKNYYPLAILPGLGKQNCVADSTGKTVCVELAPNCKQDPAFPDDPTKQICTPGLGFAGYLNIMINIFIGICAVLAMIMIVMGGVQYMTSDLVSSKQAAKQTITNAILGLLLALGAFAILNTINPDLLDVGLGNLPEAEVVVISSSDTSTGSDTSLCSDASTPDPEDVTISNININNYPDIRDLYIPTRNLALPSISKGAKTMITAQAIHEGFSSTPSPGTLSYQTKNPGNIGNTDNGDTSSYPSLEEGIKAQYRILTDIVINSPKSSYKVGIEYDCALGEGKKFDGSLYQYLRIYATGPRKTNSYLSFIISFFKNQGLTITPTTKMSEIYNMGGSSSPSSGENLNSVKWMASKLKFAFDIGGFKTGNRYTYFIFKKGTSDLITLANTEIDNTTKMSKVLLTNAEYTKIRGQIITIDVYSAGNKIGSDDIQMP